MRRPLCFFCLLFAFFIWLSLKISPPAPPDYSGFDKTAVSLTGTVSAKEYKRKSDGSLQLYVSIEHVRVKSSLSIPSRYSVLCIFSDPSIDLSLPIGSCVSLQGRLRAFSAATNPGEFDAVRYYQILRVAFRLQDAFLLEDPVPGCSITDQLSDALYRFKRRLSTVLDKTLPEEDAGIMKAMLLGEKGFLQEEIKDLYQESGIVHIIAISGLHISFLGMGLWRLLRRLRVPGVPAGLLCITLILLYGEMTGTGVSSLRAILMFALQLLAGLIGRTYDLLTAVSLAGILLLLEQPLYLWHSGFLFSFAAVLSIGLLLPVLPGRPGKVLAIPIGSLPIYLTFYHSFPIPSLFLNLLVIPLMGVLLPLGILLLLVGLMLTTLGILAGFPVRVILFVYKLLCQAGALLPVPDLMPGAPGIASVLLYLIFLLVLILAGKHFPDLCKYLWISCALLFLCIRPASPLEITFLDVGQGDGICIRCQGKTILIDGGSSSTSSLADYQLAPFLTWSGTDRIDLAILTHDDSDHCNALIDLLTGDDIQICQLLLPAIGPACQGENYQKLQTLCQEKNVPILYGARGDRLQIGGADLRILHPEREASYEDVNASSMTILLTYRYFSALLTGDLEKEGEQDLLSYMQSEYAGTASIADNAAPADNRDFSFPLTVLKVAHHGSRYATSAEFLNFFSPRIGIISAGRANRYGHPAPETLERLAGADVLLYNTQTDGAVTVKTDGKKVIMETFLSAGS